MPCNLNLPDYTDRIRLKTDENNVKYILDPIRKRWVTLTPEEWIRQNMTLYISEKLGVSISKIAHETSISYNGMTKRCDAVIYDPEGKPLVIVEYKQPKVKITQHVFDQAAIYCMQMQVPYLIVSNGIQHLFCKIDHENKKYIFAQEWPVYNELIKQI